MITITSKDALLEFICQNAPLEQLVELPKADTDFLHLTPHEVEAILKQMERRGLLEEVIHNRFNFSFIVRADAHDFFRHGGFNAQEELLEKNIQKLILEVNQLKTQFPEKAAAITAIASNIATALSLFIR